MNMKDAIAILLNQITSIRKNRFKILPDDYRRHSWKCKRATLVLKDLLSELSTQFAQANPNMLNTMMFNVSKMPLMIITLLHLEIIC